jgi:hypothetical protein
VQILLRSRFDQTLFARLHDPLIKVRKGVLKIESGLTQASLMVVIFIPLIPWRYVARSYIMQPGNCWKPD